MIKVSENRTKQVAYEEFTDSKESRWPIWRADGSGWLLLFLECLHRQNRPQASISSSCAILCGLEHLSLAEEF